jgi:hypothetical protein
MKKNRNSLACLTNAGSYFVVTYCKTTRHLESAPANLERHVVSYWTQSLTKEEEKEEVDEEEGGGGE